MASVEHQDGLVQHAYLPLERTESPHVPTHSGTLRLVCRFNFQRSHGAHSREVQCLQGGEALQPACKSNNGVITDLFAAAARRAGRGRERAQGTCTHAHARTHTSAREEAGERADDRGGCG